MTRRPSDQELSAAWSEGGRLVDIAARLGVPVSTLNHRARSLNLPPLGNRATRAVPTVELPPDFLGDRP